MADQPDSAAASLLAACPYVGLRPFDEKDKRFFYGRERDAQLLRNRILSARLTLLYAPSGVGKTSLLRVCVLPELNEPSRRTRPIYLDRWDAVDPIAVLADLVAPPQEAAEPAGGILLARLEVAQRSDRRTPVLVLDQFERFLLGHPEQWADFACELGALVRDGQCHVVLSLREEFLATLNAFRDQVPTLMDSSFRLDFLKGAAAATAIRKPAKEAGADVDEPLVVRVLDELQKPSRESAPDRLLARPPDAIDLPLLQLACERLWKASDGKQLDAGLYDRVYQGKGLREDFERGLEAGLAEAAGNDVALLLDLLAPRTGIKRTFAVDDLCVETELPRLRVDAALQHMEACRILCRPQPATIELVHDAFARLLRPWIDRRIEAMKLAKRGAEKLRQQRNRLLIFFAALLLLIAVAAITYTIKAREAARLDEIAAREAARTRGQLDELRSMNPEKRRQRAEPILTNVASYLWSQNKQAELVDLLAQEESAELVPSDFGLDPHLREAMPEARELYQSGDSVTTAGAAAQGAAAQLQLSLNPLWLEENAPRLLYAWRIVATRLNQRGLPAPPQFLLQRDPAVGRSQLRVKVNAAAAGPEVRMLSVPAPHLAAYGVVVIGDDEKAAALGALPKKLTETMIRIEGQQEKAWLVPRWTLPVWQARGDQIFPAEYALALVVGDLLLREPQLLIDAGFVSRFLAQARAAGYCDSADEALRARGGEARLREDLIAMLRDGRSIGNAGQVLNALANFPQAMSSSQLAEALRKNRPPPRQGLAVHRSAAAVDCPAAAALAGRPPPFRLQLELRGTAAALAAFRTAAGGPRPDLLAAIAEARREAYAATGLVPGNVEPLIGYPVAGAGCEVQLLTPLPGRRRSASLSPCSPGALGSWLQAELIGRAHRLLNAELVRAALQSLPVGIRDWLLVNYSLTDLKLALRDVLRADGDAPNAASPGTTTPRPQTPPQTLRQLPWLLGSLAYWNAVCERSDAACLGKGLREAQAARLAGSSADAGLGVGEVGVGGEAIAQSTQALLAAGNARQVGAAAAAFARASAADEARQRFVQHWVAQARHIQLVQLAPLCTLPKVADVATAPAPDLQALVESADFLASGAAASAAELRRLQLCRDSGGLASPASAAAAGDALAAIAGAPAAAGWSADEQYLAGFWLLDAVRRAVLPPSFHDKAAPLLANALRRWTDESARISPLNEVLRVCSKSRAQRSCLWALDRSVDSVKDSAWMPLQLGLAWASLPGGRRSDAYRALALVEHAERNAAKGRADPAFRLWLVEARASANYLLAFSGEKERGETAVALNKELLAISKPGKEGDIRIGAFRRLSDLHLLVDQQEDARRFIERGLAENPKSVDLWQSRAFVALAMGRADVAVEHARNALQPLSKDPEALFAWVLMRLFAGQPDEEADYESRRLLASGHDYREYVRMMMVWRMGGVGSPAGRELIDDRWRTVDRQTWPERLEQGDIEVWREMYIGYYGDKLEGNEMLRLIADEKTFEDSDMGELPQSRAVFLAEFHFYDALKQVFSGDVATRSQRYRDALQKAADSQAIEAWEYHMARYLLRAATGSQR